MVLTREDKLWLAQLAALVVRAISEVIVNDWKTKVSIERTQDIIRFGKTDKSENLLRVEGTVTK